MTYLFLPGKYLHISIVRSYLNPFNYKTLKQLLLQSVLSFSAGDPFLSHKLSEKIQHDEIKIIASIFV